KTVPLARRVEVEDIAQTALYLATNRSVTGTIVAVDGGQHL
ncbi:MAG: SDR family oxidoreductase, partial [Lentisphaeria bacterium]|nr:SDR family oxidoreductase [Lentisphaeria bacterium]